MQEIFVSLWVRSDLVSFHTSVSGYLYTALRYQILKHYQSSKLRAKYVAELTAFRASLVDNSNEDTINLNQLEEAVERSLSGLPQRCREIFRLSRQQHKTIQEIAVQLNISHKTVENNLSIALKHLRVSLGEFMVVAIALGIS